MELLEDLCQVTFFFSIFSYKFDIAFFATLVHLDGVI